MCDLKLICFYYALGSLEELSFILLKHIDEAVFYVENLVYKIPFT